MQLPTTWYDIQSRREPLIWTNAAREAPSLLEKDGGDKCFHRGVWGPFRFFDDAVKPLVEVWAQKLVEGARKEGVYRTPREAKAYLESEEGGEAMEDLSARALDAYIDAVNFSMFGKKTFYVSDGLVQQLANTRMNVKAPMLQMPFPCFQLVFTSKEMIDAVYAASPTDINTVRYDLPVTAVVYECEGTVDHPGIAYEKDIRTLQVMFFQGEGKNSDLSHGRHYLLREKWNLEQVLHVNWGKILDDEEQNEWLEKLRRAGDSYDESDLLLPSKEEIDELFTDTTLIPYRVVINAILYITSVNAETESRPSPVKNMEKDLKFIRNEQERQKARRQIEHSSRLPYIVIGGSVKPVTEDRPTSIDGKRSLTVRFMVKGFFRWQVYGPGREGRRHQWIKPFYKGPEMAELVNKPYLVREPKTGTE